MRLLESGPATLDELPELLPGQPKRRPRSWVRKLDTLVIIAGLFLGGFGTGYIYKARVDEAIMAQQRQDHLDELQRLTATQAREVGTLAKSATTAASAASVAGEQASAAAEAVTEVAKKLDKAPNRKTP